MLKIFVHEMFSLPEVIKRNGHKPFFDDSDVPRVIGTGSRI